MAKNIINGNSYDANPPKEDNKITKQYSYQTPNLIGPIFAVLFIIGCISIIVNNQDFSIKDLLINWTTKTNQIIPINKIFDYSNMPDLHEKMTNITDIVKPFQAIYLAVYDTIMGIVNILKNLGIALSMIFNN